MADKTGTERIPSADIGSAVKAKVEKLKEAQVQIEQRTRELEAERRKIDADRRELGKMEEALETMKAELDKRDDDLSVREADLQKGQRGLKETQDRFTAEDHRLKEWAKALQTTENEIKTLQVNAKTERDDIFSKLSEANSKLTGLVEREELVASREAALGGSLDRLSKIGDTIATREKALSAQQEEFIRLQNERIANLRQREEEFTSLMETLTRRMRDQEANSASLSEMELALKDEFEKLSGERQRLVAKERNLMEAEKSLASVLEASGIEWETAPAPQPKPALERPPAPEPRGSPPPPPPKHKETLEQEFERVVAAGNPKVGKSDAIDRMNKALEIAKRARDTGQDVTDVRKILKNARTAFENQNWEEAVRLSEQILVMLESTPPASR